MFKEGIVIINDLEIIVEYKFDGVDEIFCIVQEDKGQFKYGDTFYTHYKSLKV